jgi:hypothetical protein
MLTALDACWYDGQPHRTPDRSVQSKTDYSSDQFVPQWTAIYLCYRFGDSKTKEQAFQLAKKFVDRLAINDWKLTDSPDAHFNAQRQGGRFLVMLVSREMGLERLWKDDLDAAMYGFYRDLWFAGAQLRAIEASVSTPEEPTSFHNLFWECLAINYCEGSTKEMHSLVCKLSIGSEKQDMALFLWAAHRGKKLCGWLDEWPDQWSKKDYVWQRSRAQNATPGDANERYPRLDYMVLVRLVALGSPF